MKTLFKGEETLQKHITNNTPKEVIERSFIITFLKGLPIEGLKKLINYQEIDFENEELWKDPKNHQLLQQLQHQDTVKYTCELYLDNE